MLSADLPAPPPPVGRLAPSPTGAQHVGNARTFLLAWLQIRVQGGQLLLRLEDIDSPRVKPWAAEQALTDLRWLGLAWDAGPDRGGPHAPYVQTERLPHYRAALAELMRLELVYPCTCSRSDVEAAASAPHVGQEGPRYPGTCAGRRVRDAANLTAPYAWRFRAPREAVAFVDGCAGRQTCQPAADLGDFVVGKSDGGPAYQLAVVIDDHAMGVSEVLRGADLLPSTFRQLALYQALGFAPPRFTHVPLVVGPDGRRLAKRHGDTRLATLREQGVAPERLIGYLAFQSGLTPSPAAVTARELIPHFTLARLPREPLVFTPQDWDALLAR